MNQEARRAAEQDSARAVIAFFTLLDERDHERQWDQMTPDGIWDRAGRKLGTRQDFLAAMAERPEHLTIRHMVNNILVAVAADYQSATATFNLMVYRYLADRGGKPAPIGTPSAIAAFRAQMKSSGGGWRIAYLEGETLFAG